MTDSQDWTPPEPGQLDETPLWQYETTGRQPSGAAPRKRPDPPAVVTPDPPSRNRGRDPRKLYRRGNVALSVFMALLVAGGIANALGATKTPSKPVADASPKTHAAHPAAANTSLSVAQQQFVSGVQTGSKSGLGLTTRASQIAAFGQQVCAERHDGQAQLKVISGAQGRWKNSSPMWADATVRLAEKDLCSSYLTPETVTFIVRGTAGAAEVTYGTGRLHISGTVPMRVIRPLRNRSYYEIDAQLEGGGTVTCVIKIDGILVSTATASGGDNIALCRIWHNPGTHLWVNENNHRP
jgi:hypothetical protein